MFKRFDTDRSGRLSPEQLTALLMEVDGSTPPGTVPHADEVEYVMQVCFEAGKFSVDSEAGVGLHWSDLAFAISTFTAFTRRRAELHELVAKHDASGTGALSNEELKALPTELVASCGGTTSGVLTPPDDEDVEQIRASADFNNRDDGGGVASASRLLYALNYWAQCCGEEEFFRLQAQRRATRVSCCAVL